MTERLSPTYSLITDYQQFLDLCSTLERCDRIAIDTEADSMHHYPERVCLVQVATPESTYLLDPLALVDLSPLGPALSSPRVLKLLHGADYDVRGLNRDWGLTFTNLFDTHIAARFLGLERVGLAALLLDVLGIDIPKDRRIQRADWSKRPLDDRALEYAAADVCYLFDLHDILTERLQELGRMEWVREECERQCEVRHTPQDLRDTSCWLCRSHASWTAAIGPCCWRSTVTGSSRRGARTGRRRTCCRRRRWPPWPRTPRRHWRRTRS